jgi:hypothetical protein
MQCDPCLHELEKALHDSAFEELRVTPFVFGECQNRSPSNREKFLQLLLATL